MISRIVRELNRASRRLLLRCQCCNARRQLKQHARGNTALSKVTTPSHDAKLANHPLKRWAGLEASVEVRSGTSPTRRQSRV